MKILVYDLEIVRCIPDRRQPPNRHYQYCAGWGDFGGMGISVVGWAWLAFANPAADPAPAPPPQVADWDNPDQRAEFLADLGAAQILAGFNSAGFDDRLLAAHQVKATTGYDLLAEVRRAAFGSFSGRDQPRGQRYNLEAIAQANGHGKTGSGAAAPQLWQDGQKQAVRDYCANDVAVTRALLGLGLAGKLKDPNTRRSLSLRPLANYAADYRRIK